MKGVKISLYRSQSDISRVMPLNRVAECSCASKKDDHGRSVEPKVIKK